MSEPYPGVRILPPEPKPGPVITEEREPEPVILFLVTCASAPECPETFQGHGSYFMAWQQAVGAGWRTDVSRQRRCPQCVAARRPSPTMYVAEDDLGRWLRRTDWLRQMAGPDAASVALGQNRLPIVMGVQPPPEASDPYPVPAPVAEPEAEGPHSQADVAYPIADEDVTFPAEPERDPEEDAPAGRAVADDEEPAPAADPVAVLRALAEKQDAAKEPDATKVIAVTDAPTEAVPVVKEGESDAS
jgi:hypothetical protein